MTKKDVDETICPEHLVKLQSQPEMMRSYDWIDPVTREVKRMRGLFMEKWYCPITNCKFYTKRGYKTE